MMSTPQTTAAIVARSTNEAAIDPAEISLYLSASAAGFPVPGDDTVDDTLNVHDYVVKNPASTFFVRVVGDSMEGAGIFSGDILVVDRSVTAVSGAIVVAVVDGGLVVKRLQKTAMGMVLASEQEGYEPIIINQDEGCYVWGVVTASVRQF